MGSEATGRSRASGQLARGTLLVLALAFMAVLALERSAAAAPAKHTILQDDALLLHGTNEEVDGALSELADMGVDWVRLTASWSSIAPDPDATTRPEGFDPRDPSSYPPGAWSRLDRAVTFASYHGLRANLDIAFFAPSWAVTRRIGSRERWKVSPTQLAHFAEAVSRRYSGRWVRGRTGGMFASREVRLPAAAAFTLWNEPNHRGFLQPQWRRTHRGLQPYSPHLYRRMVRKAVPRIREAAPGSLVLIGGTSSVGSHRPRSVLQTMAPLRFLREMACVDERGRPLRSGPCRDFQPIPGDGWSHHPYSLGLAPWERDRRPDNVRLGDLDRLSRTLRALAVRGRTERPMPIYITEYGYQTNPPDPTARTGLNRQARYLSEAELIAHVNPHVASFAQFLLVDRPLRGLSGDYQSGLRFNDGRPKPAEQAFRTPFVVRSAGPGRIRFWGRVRSAREPTRVRVTTPGLGGRWRPVPGMENLLTDERGMISGIASGRRGRLYRLETVEPSGTGERGVALGPTRRHRLASRSR